MKAEKFDKKLMIIRTLCDTVPFKSSKSDQEQERVNAVIYLGHRVKNVADKLAILKI